MCFAQAMNCKKHSNGARIPESIAKQDKSMGMLFMLPHQYPHQCQSPCNPQWELGIVLGDI
jgi:hypothetical protein